MRVWALAVTLGLLACGAEPPLPAPDPPPPSQHQLDDQPVPLPSPWPRVLGKPGQLSETFQAGLRDWKDVREDGHDYPWLLPGRWFVSGRSLVHDEIRRAPAVSFRRYAGRAFGTPDGELPATYRVSLTLTPIAAHEQSGPPVGDLGVPIFYLDPLHYLEAVFKTETFEIWACDGGLPVKWRGWHRLYDQALRTEARQTRQLSAEVDAHAGTMRVSIDGKPVATVRHELLQPYSHWFALRATGNHVIVSDVRIESP